MKLFHIKRFLMTDYATWGVLIYEDSPFCLTLENPWDHNKPFVSCIPVGVYTASVIKNEHSKHTGLYRLDYVEGRTLIDIHAGNWPTDTSGCILLGMGIQKYGIQESVDAVHKLMSFTKREQIRIIISKTE